MKDQTSTRIGLPVVLAFAIVFGLILTKHSSRYDVSPPRASTGAGAANETSVYPISRTPLNESTARHWEGRPPVDRRSSHTVESPEARSAEPSPLVDSTDRHQADPPNGYQGDADRGEADRPSTKPAGEPKRERKIPEDRPAGQDRTPKPVEGEPAAPERGHRPHDLKLPGRRRDTGFRTVRADEQRAPNSAGPAPVVVRVRPATYVIKPRDNLTRICKAVYGTSSPRVVQALYEANRDRVKNKNHVMVGQRLRIPAWPPGTAKQARPLIPLSQRAVEPGAPRTTIKLPVQADAQGSARQRRAGGPGSLSRQTKTTRTSTRRGGRGRIKQTQAKHPRRYRWHRVRRNESLSTIARDKLGNGRRWYSIWKLNKRRLRKPNRLPAGILIKVPLAVPATGSTVLAVPRDESSSGVL